MQKAPTKSEAERAAWMNAYIGRRRRSARQQPWTAQLNAQPAVILSLSFRAFGLICCERTAFGLCCVAPIEVASKLGGDRSF
jgi:hypothetical protein